MFTKASEKTASLLILVGAPFVCLFITLESVTDPVNATKLTAAGALGFALFSIFIAFAGKGNFLQFKYFLIAACLFLLASINAALNSSSPMAQNIYGAYGRNTGLVAYSVLSMVAIGALLLRSESSFSRIIWGLQFAGLVNVIYCAWVILFGDFLSWNNPYGNILGLFGNPNFISAFLGMFITTLMAFSVAKTASWKYRVVAVLVGAIAFYEVVDSHSIQGIVVTAGGIAIVGFFAIRAYLKNLLFTYGYLLAVGIVGVFAILGTLQKGPLSFVYKTSVSLRGEYWRAGLTMGMDHPLTGVGMDSYGDWYRRARSESAATVLPGPKTVTNASHNVVIDFFAYGGWPLLLAYLAMLTLAAIAIVKVLLRTKSYNPTFVAMVSAWTCYEVQSLISINQIGLAIWGWLLTGALIAYEYTTRSSTSQVKAPTAGPVRSKQSVSTGVISPQLVAGVGALIGILIAVPPMSADTKWRSATSSGDATKVLAALDSGYLSPSDSARYAQAVQLFASNNLMEQAHDIALKAIEFNPDYFDAWRVLYYLSNSTEAEKVQAQENMKRLDPRNPDVLAP
ncbi:O-antigen ligase-like protein [Candidatus Planktophila versatilis]|uniref:O-antigen ligase-like protein n=1 Tax=Candidatus Planktophila versatilis TaxID=1884905 RepID=A0AAC9YUK4_9ACTN|nr:O-antigen ligase family protein [Candidatus Planktophila versatilis]ASY22063.1 O-antigen ligase-like protein [Candidatus Planktophila versatilis]